MARVVFRFYFSFVFLSFLVCSPTFADLIVDQHINELVNLAIDGDSKKFIDYVKNQDLLQKKDKDGHSPIFAAMFGPPELVNEFLQLGVPLEERDNLGFTPLISAALLGYPQVVSKLLNSGAQIEAKNDDGQTALMISILGQISNQVDINATGDIQWHNRWAQVIELLLKRGADVNSTDIRGVSPLFIAIFSQDYSLCRTLIDAGANTNHKLPSGVSMLRFAKIGSSKAIVDLLIANGAKI